MAKKKEENITGVVDAEKPKKVKYKVLRKWEAPMRIHHKHHRQDYLMVIFIGLPLITFFVIVGQYMLIAVTVALIFLTFVLWNTKPGEVTHKITTLGVYSIDKLYKWKELESYWISKVQNVYLLNIETNLRFPGRLVILLGNKNDATEIHNTLQDYLDYEIIDNQGLLNKKLDGLYIPLQEEPVEDKVLLDFDHESLKQSSK
jgi:hypothetical protein